MKAFFTLVLLALAGPALAQAPAGQRSVQPPPPPAYAETPSHFQHQADSLLQYLDKSQVPTGILYDRVATMASLDVFGQSYGDADTSGVNHFMQAYYELHVADYRNPGTAPTRQILRDNARYYGERGQVLIGSLRYRFNYIDPNAVRNNQLSWLAGPDSQLLDVAGRAGSPYSQLEVVVGAALADTLHQGAVSFRLDPASTFTNTGAALSSAVIDFGDGGAARSCAPGQWMSVSYATAGPKVLRYQFTYADGQQFVTYSRLYVSTAAGYASRGTATAGVDPCWTEPGFTALAAFGGKYGKADVSYYYSTGPSGTAPKPCPASSELNVTKPVIVIDGFDHNDTRNGKRMFNEYLSYTDASNNPQNLGAELRDEGYDVVILNPTNEYSTASGLGGNYQYISRHGGSDYMERNGLLLVSLIQELNRQLQAAGSTEQIVVVGPSMGGQIARYALAYMEANNLPHNTRLYASLDSPHNGANIPIGLQQFINYFATETQDFQLVDALAAIDSPASRELVQHYYGMGTYFLPHPSRTAFMNTVRGYRPGGFPINVRRIAVTNGALDGGRQRDQNGQIINDQDQAFFMEQKGTPSSSTSGVIVRTLFPFFPLPSLATRLITTASARVWYAPGNGQTSRVLRTYILGTGSHGAEAEGASNSCGLDGAPGGYRNFFSEAVRFPIC